MMFDHLGPRSKRTVRILAVAYAHGHYALDEGDLDAVTTHVDAFFVGLPLQMRAVVLIVLRLIELRSLFVSPVLRSLSEKTVEEQRRVYDRWFARKGYVTALLGQMLHLTFVGSLYSLPKLQKSIGYVRVRSVVDAKAAPKVDANATERGGAP